MVITYITVANWGNINHWRRLNHHLCFIPLSVRTPKQLANNGYLTNPLSEKHIRYIKDTTVWSPEVVNDEFYMLICPYASPSSWVTSEHFPRVPVCLSSVVAFSLFSNHFSPHSDRKSQSLLYSFCCLHLILSNVNNIVVFYNIAIMGILNIFTKWITWYQKRV